PPQEWRLRPNGGAGMNRFGKRAGLAGLAACGLAVMAVASPAVAGTIYRCDAGGVASYVSKRIKGANCTVATTYRPNSPSRPSRPSTTPGAAGAAGSSDAAAGVPASLNANAPASFMGGGASAPAVAAPAP